MRNFFFALFTAWISFQALAQNYSNLQSSAGKLNRFYVDLIGKAATLDDVWGLFRGMRAG